MSIQPRIKNIEKRLLVKSSQIEPQSNWKFPIKYSTEKPGVYFLTKWIEGKFVEVEATKEEIDIYYKDIEETVIFMPKKNPEI